MTKAPTQPAVLETWEVTWWAETDGALVLHSRSFEMPGAARQAYAALHSSTDPKIIRHHWNMAKARWETEDVIGQAVTPERVADVNARGFATLRAIIAHGRGHDSRGVVGSLDEFLATDGKDREPAERLVSDDPTDCVVCDYLCQHGLSVEDAHQRPVEAPATLLDYRDVTEPDHEERF